LKVQPVQKYRTPIYPTRLAIQSDSELLVKHTPPAWRKTARMASLAAFFLGVHEGISSEKAAVVAPIFEHGDGRGAIGCMMVAPPVFLSEEEALQIIQEELQQAKIILPVRDYPIPGVIIEKKKRCLNIDSIHKDIKIATDKNKNKNSASRIIQFATNNLTKDVIISTAPYSCDIANASQHIAVEFVSREEYFDLGGVKTDYMTVQSFELKENAQKLTQNVRNNGKNLYFGAFYDPHADLPYNQIEKLQEEMSSKLDRIPQKSTIEGRSQARSIETDYQIKVEKFREEAKLESKRLLRLQVKDFTEWLKGQGVI
jgi:hypothetical protein